VILSSEPITFTGPTVSDRDVFTIIMRQFGISLDA